MKFPGSATPALAPLRWSDWTGRGAVLAFGGVAEPAVAPLRWSDWTAPATRAPKVLQATQAPVIPDSSDISAPIPVPAARPSPAVERPSPAVDARVGSVGPALPAERGPELLGLAELARSMAESSERMAHAHALFLQSQQDHLDRLAALQAHLDDVVGKLGG